MIADLIHKIAGMEEEAENGHEFSARPSLAGPERCIRQMVYWSLGFQKQPFPGRTILVFDDGNWHEELTNNWIRKSVYRLHSEQMQVDVRHPMTIGHIDGILTDMNGTDIFYEHKSINHFTFQKFWDTSDLPLDYLTQCAIYMEGLQKIQPEILRGLLLIKNKNTAQYMEYELAYNSRMDELCVRSKIRSTGEKKQMDVIFPNIVAEATEKFELVLEYAYKKRLPKRQYEIDHWRCIHPDTRIKTQLGWKRASNVRVEDRVFTLQGEYKRVSAVRKIKNTKQAYKIKGYNLLPIEVTSDHLVLVEEATSHNGNNKGIARWMQAEEIFSEQKNKKFRMLYVIDRHTDPLASLGLHELTLLGFYMSEGCLGNRAMKDKRAYRIEFTFHVKERTYVERIRWAAKKLFGAKVYQKVIVDKRNGRKSLRATINSRKCVEFIEKHVHGGVAHKKSYKNHILNMPSQQLKYLLDIMICGDGCRLLTKNSETIVYSSTSKKLALQVQEMFWKQNKIAGIAVNNPTSETFGDKPCYHVRHFPNAKYNYGRIEDNIFYSPIQYIEPCEVSEVVDISVPESHNFLTEGGIVHNCEYCGWAKMCWGEYEKEFKELKTDTMLPEEVADLVRYKQETSAHRLTMEKEEKELTNKIKDLMKEVDAREGKAGEYRCKLTLMKNQRIDKSLLSAEAVAKATVESMYEKLTISKLKKEVKNESE